MSEGCRNCYAERVAARFSDPGLPYDGLARRTPSGPRWTGDVRVVEEHLEDPLRWQRPRRIFVNSMSDLFHESVPDEWVDRIFAVMALAPRHTFQVLTKRPARMRAYLRDHAAGGRHVWTAAQEIEMPRGRIKPDPGWPLPNVWLGTSIENQQTADERLPLLLDTPAAVRFVSAEPLLGSIDLGAWLVCGPEKAEWMLAHYGSSQPLDWVIVGGESGPGARPMHPDWARDLRDQCRAAGVNFFFKQWGSWFPAGEKPPSGAKYEIGADKALSHVHLWADQERNVSFLVGKKNAGRLLDGRTWDEMPGAVS